MARGDNLIFSATGVTDGTLLRGVRFYGEKAKTHSLLMRNQTKTVRYIEAMHNLRYKTLPSKELHREKPV